MNEKIVWVATVVSGLLLSALVVLMFFIPFGTFAANVNRKTGETVGRWTEYWGFVSGINNPGESPGVKGYSGLTAEDKVLCYSIEKSYLFGLRSKSVETFPENRMISDIAAEMFEFPRIRHQSHNAPLTKEVAEALILERIPVWNSSEVDTNPAGVLRRYEEENKKYLPPKKH